MSRRRHRARRKGPVKWREPESWRIGREALEADKRLSEQAQPGAAEQFAQEVLERKQRLKQLTEKALADLGKSPGEWLPRHPAHIEGPNARKPRKRSKVVPTRERVAAYLRKHPHAKAVEVATALKLADTTASYHVRRLRPKNRR